MRGRSDRAGARLRALRGVLGFSQREMAVELGVTHGAVGSWETGARVLPGPVQKLMELYEEELGMDDVGNDPTGPIERLRTSWASRSLRLSRTAAGSAMRATAAGVHKLFVDESRAGKIAATTQTAIARQVVETLGNMKGLAMKVGQMVSYLDFALPASAREVMAALQASTRPLAPSVVVDLFLEDELASEVNGGP